MPQCHVCGRRGRYMKYSLGITEPTKRTRYYLCSLPCALEMIVSMAGGRLPAREEEVKVL